MASSTAGVIIPFCEAIKLSFQELLSIPLGAIFSSNTHTLRSSTPRSRSRICRRLLPLLQQEEYWFLATPRRALIQ
ncbi:hypothetical protein OPV22_029111 [Ensete ventricosum]|uniref:Uncharacterized protein n=1 Tax=Ensete ventricosum TaxID=4639 RepID=A0AAV8Q4X9_ENSVE|nr:hypothetical protein OPV22_029111 [Ensete ventricosum]